MEVSELKSLCCCTYQLNTASSEFIDGTMEMTEGATAYFHIDLEPGDYAWIAEIPDPADHGMLKTFTVKDSDAPASAY